MAKQKYYVRHIAFEDQSNSFFGPFKQEELADRMCDDVAEALVYAGEVSIVKMTDKDAKAFVINPRSYWMGKLKQFDNVINILDGKEYIEPDSEGDTQDG